MQTETCATTESVSYWLSVGFSTVRQQTPICWLMVLLVRVGVMRGVDLAVFGRRPWRSLRGWPQGIVCELGGTTSVRKRAGQRVAM